MDVEQAIASPPGRRIPGGAAGAGCALALALVAGAAWLGVLNGGGVDRLALLVAVTSSAVVGGVIAAHRPGNLVGVLLVASACSLAATGVAAEYATYAVATAPGALPVPAAMAWLSGWLWVPGAVLVLVFVPLLFPDGRLFSPGWRPVGWFAVAFSVFLAGISALEPGPLPGTGLVNPLGAPMPAPLAAVLDVLVLPLWLGLVAVAAASLVVRFRRSGRVQRQQIKWLAFAAVLVPAWFLLNAPVERSAPALFVVVDALALSAVPIAAGIAVVRHRLYDIDLVINRTVVYAALTACVVGIYVLVVGYLGQLFRVADDLAVSLVATGIVAVLFAPLRDRLQRAVNQVMYGERHDPYAVVSRLGRRLEAALAPDAVLPAVVETVREALKLPYAAIALGSGGDQHVVASSGSPTERPQRLPLTHRNEPIGELLLGTRPGEDHFSARDRRLLEDVARQAGLAAHSVRLTADLQLARERLVSTREEERRRLRRDLHDGLGPMLGSLTLKLDVACELLEREPATARALLAGLKEQAQIAVTDVRRLVYALRPPALDDLGLLGAVGEIAVQHGMRELDVAVSAPETLPDLPAAVEVAAYRIVGEAVTNVARHAGARRCRVGLQVVDGALVVEVDDDGRGRAVTDRTGIGIAAMRERAEELGGTCLVGTSPTGGTRVLATLPCAGRSAARPAAAAR